jgi:hypothetical protein
VSGAVFGLLLAGFLLAGFGLIGWRASRPHTVVAFQDGAAHLQRGQLPPGLLRDLGDVARHASFETGALQISGQGEGLKLTTVGLNEGTDQRVRNVVLLRRQQIRRPAR